MQQKNNTTMFGIIAVVVIGAILAGTIILKPKEGSDNNETTDTSQASSDSSSADPSATYKDGTYNATGEYTSPGGNEEIAVTITITNNMISSSSVTPKAASSESREYQQDFADNYKKLVEGKKVGSVSLSHVAGSSLTSRGFNKALNAIRDQAQS